MTQDSNGKYIKSITECAAGADTFYIVYYKGMVKQFHLL